MRAKPYSQVQVSPTCRSLAPVAGVAPTQTQEEQAYCAPLGWRATMESEARKAESLPFLGVSAPFAHTWHRQARASACLLTWGTGLSLLHLGENMRAGSCKQAPWTALPALFLGSSSWGGGSPPSPSSLQVASMALWELPVAAPPAPHPPHQNTPPLSIISWGIVRHHYNKGDSDRSQGSGAPEGGREGRRHIREKGSQADNERREDFSVCG